MNLQDIQNIFKILFEKFYLDTKGHGKIVEDLQILYKCKIEIIIPFHICLNNEIEFSRRESIIENNSQDIIKLYIGININDIFYYKSKMITEDEVHRKIYDKLYKKINNLVIEDYLNENEEEEMTTDDIKYIIENCLLKKGMTPLLNTYSHDISSTSKLEKYIKLNHRKGEFANDNLVFNIEEGDKYVLKINYIETDKVENVIERENIEDGFCSINHDIKNDSPFKIIKKFIKNTKDKYKEGRYFIDKVPLESYCVEKKYINKWSCKYDKNKNNVYSHVFTLFVKNNKLILV